MNSKARLYSKKFPLSLPQRDIYFHQLQYPQSAYYNIGANIKIKGKISVDAMVQAYHHLIQMNDVFKARVIKKKRMPYMYVPVKFDGELNLIDFSSSKNPYKEMKSFVNERFLTPFDLESDQPLQFFYLIKINDSLHYLFSYYHHLITDGWGTSLMFQRFTELYNHIICEQTLPNYEFSYSSFVEHSLNYEASLAYKQDESYWRGRLSSYKKANIPQRFFYKKERAGSRKVLYIKRSVYDQFIRSCNDAKVSTFHGILGILYIYLVRQYNTQGMTVGVPVLNRSNKAFKKTVGLFMNVNPLIINVNEGETFQSLVGAIKNQLAADYRHQQYPLSHIKRNLFDHDESMFNIVLSYEKHDYSATFKNTNTTVIPLTHKSEQAALAIYIREFDAAADVKIDFDYNSKFFNNRQMTQFVEHLENLMFNVINNFGQPINQINFLLKEETAFFLTESNKFWETTHLKNTVDTLVDQKAFLYGEKIAVFDDVTRYSYNQIRILSDQLATELNSKYGESKFPVGILMERSADLIVAILGVLKAGRCFIPLDPSFPIERLEYIMSDSQAQLLISNYKFGDRLKLNHQFFYEDFIDKCPENLREGLSFPRAQPDDNAYIIYTSGSTGKPKGVVVQHAALTNFLLSMQKEPGVKMSDTIFSVTTQSFDISILEFLLPLITGASVYVASSKVFKDPIATTKLINDVGPNIIQATPSFFQMLFNAGWQGNKSLRILCGGDSLNRSLCKKLLTSCDELWNMYGPTETTIWSTVKRITSVSHVNVVGKPIANTSIFILDKQLNFVSIDSPGEIFIGGLGLAKGYLNKVQLTEEKFIKSPFRPDDLLYKTGDIGKWNFNHEVEFLGRSDNQVKIRGFRIELSEIENCLLQHPLITNVVVIAIKDAINHNDRLIAFVKRKSIEISEHNLIQFLRNILPEYMVPQQYIYLNEFPTTLNNKIDRLSLANIADKYSITDLIPEIPIKKLTKSELMLVQAFKKALSVKQVNPNDNFFFLGGNSLSAVNLIAFVKKKANITLDIGLVFKYPVLKALAKKIDQNFGDSGKISISDTAVKLALTPSQLQIWSFSLLNEAASAYNMCAAFRTEGVLNLAILNDAVNYLFKRHEALRGNVKMTDSLPFWVFKSQSQNQIFDFQEHNVDSKLMIPQIINNLQSQHLNLSDDVLFQLHVLTVKGKSEALVFICHHLILDGRSVGILVEELSIVYNALLLNKDPKFLPLRQPFQDYIRKVQTGNHNQNYWANKMANFIPKRSFEYDHDTNGAFHTCDSCYWETDSVELIDFSKRMNTTPYVVLISVLNMVIASTNEKFDICLGSVLSSRDSDELLKAVGMFSNTILLRNKFAPEMTVNELIRQVHEEVSDCYANQHSPLQFTATFNGERVPFFDVMIVYQTDEDLKKTFLLGENLMTLMPENGRLSRFPLVLNFFCNAEKLTCKMDFNTTLYKQNTIEFIGHRLVKAIESILKNPNKSVIEYDLRLDFEKTKEFLPISKFHF